MSSVSEPGISPADDSPTCDPPVGHPSARDPHQSFSASTPIHFRYHTTERYGISSFSRGHIHTVLAVNSVATAWLIADPQAAVGRFSDSAGRAGPVKKSAVLAVDSTQAATQSRPKSTSIPACPQQDVQALHERPFPTACPEKNILTPARSHCSSVRGAG